MKYEVKFSCGHTATVELFGPTKERERKLAWYEESGECPECYAKGVEARKADGCEPRIMHYGDYKTNWFWCATARDSYNAKDKTIAVYIPEAYNGLEDLISVMARNDREKGKRDAYTANAYAIKDALESGKINQEQVKTLVAIAKKIFEF